MICISLAARHQAAFAEDDPALAEDVAEEGPAETTQKVDFDDKMGAKVIISLISIYLSIS